MKKTISILPLLVLVSFFAFVFVGQGGRQTEFPETRELKARTISLDTALFRYPFRIRVHSDKVVVQDLHGADCFFHLFSYPDFEYRTSFGTRGQAPDELLAAETFRWDGEAIWTLDSGKSELVRWNSTVMADSMLRMETVNLDKSLLRALDFLQYDDSTFVIPDYSGENRFSWVNHRGKLLQKQGTIPCSDEDALHHSRPALAQAWRSFIDYNPRNGVLAAVTQLGEVLEVYNLCDSTHVVNVGKQGEPKFFISQGYGIPTGIMGFSDVQVTDRAIYAVFHGHTFKEIMRSRERGEIHPDGGKYIYVFSLDGKPLRKYVLDHYVYGISVDETKGIILATDVNQDEPIIEFSMT